MAERFPIPCCLHGKGCGVTSCDGMASVPDIPIRGEDGETLYYPRCYKAGEPRLLDPITLEEFQNLRCGGAGTKTVRPATPTVEPPQAAEEFERTKIAPPNLADMDDCKRFISELSETLEREYCTRLHTHNQAVDYILTEAKAGELYFDDCKLARRIRKDRNWERSTFFNYSKPKRLPKPRNLRKAARKRATQKKSREDLVVLTQRRQ